MEDPTTFDALKVGLANPRPAPKKLRLYVSQAFPDLAPDAQIDTSSATRLPNDSLCHMDDVVLIREPGNPDLMAGQVLNHLNISGTPITFVHFWGTRTGEVRCGAAVWMKAFNPRIILTSSVLASAVHALSANDECRILIPRQFI